MMHRARTTTTSPQGRRTMTAPSAGGGAAVRAMMAGGGGGFGFGGASMPPPPAFVAAATKGDPAGHHRSLRRRAAPSSSSSVVVAPAAVLLSSSSSASFSPTLADDSFHRGGGGGGSVEAQSRQQQQRRERVPRPDEPYLYDIPPELRPTYGTVPLLLRAALVVASALLAGRRSVARFLSAPAPFWRVLLDHLPPSPPLAGAGGGRLLTLPVVRGALSFLLRTALATAVASLAIQERFYPPSKATTAYLARRGELPSGLSRYQVVEPVDVMAACVPSDDGDGGDRRPAAAPPPAPVPIGVHSIQYARRGTYDDGDGGGHGPGYDGISLHHGFGASSLSWLPVLPRLVERLGRVREGGKSRCVGVAHDAPGFGFTDRPEEDDRGEGLEQYQSENSAGIGLALLEDSLAREAGTSSGEEAVAGSSQGGEASGADGDEDEGENGDAAIAVFGHSMGARAAMLTALRAASRGLRPGLVVLVAPALEDGAILPSRKISGAPQPPSDDVGRLRQMALRVRRALKRLFLDRSLRYGLRRLVCGTGDFWRRGLALAWGDPSRLSDSDVLRFRWPTVGEGWEGGLINFARAKFLPSSPSRGLAVDDGQLLREVAGLEGTRVMIVYGSRDRVVRIEGDVAEKLKREYPNVELIRLEGLGHDPFEEDVDVFLAELEKALE